MGGGGEPPVQPQSMQAKLFEGHVHEEGWETITKGTYALAAVMIVFGVGLGPETDITTVSLWDMYSFHGIKNVVLMGLMMI